MKKLRILHYLFIGLLTGMAASVIMSCDDTESYADLLQKERKACNAFLADNKVVNEVPADSVFQVGPNAPYYRLDDEGNLYMQVLNAGDPKDRAEYDDLIYFRFKRMSIVDWWLHDEEVWSGNADNMVSSPTNFRYDNYTLSSTSQYGAGIQEPLKFLGIGCEVNIIIKSQFGFTDEIAYVTPFLYNVRYFRPQT